MARCEVLCEVLSVVQNKFKSISTRTQSERQISKRAGISPTDILKDLHRVKVTLSIGDRNLSFYSLVKKIQNHGSDETIGDTNTKTINEQILVGLVYCQSLLS
jgi:hypothetical protein